MMHVSCFDNTGAKFETQISYASTSVVLRDKSVYQSFFRTVPSDELLPAALATTMNYYGWRQIAVVTEEENQFEEVCDKVYYYVVAINSVVI